ncbi:MAG: GGDEF domain-containing protein [Candidatus Zixiibacteriota bacterium]
MQTALLIILAGLVVLLTLLLTVRLRREHKQSSPYDPASLERFAELIRTSILEGDIQNVANRVSQLLREPCGCARIMFLRRRGRWLELSYHYGLENVGRRAVQVRNTLGLIDALRASPLPDSIGNLRLHLPKKLMDSLSAWGCNLYFPVFWRDHLYGIYFVAGNAEVMSPAFRVIVASVAQSLSAAYHVKWHEHKYERLQEELNTLRTVNGKTARESPPPQLPGILKLVRHRDSETLVGRIFDEVRRDVGLHRCTFFYQAKHSGEPVRLDGDNGPMNIVAPDRESFARLVTGLEGDIPHDLSMFSRIDAGLAPLEENLRAAGLQHVASFQLTEQRKGVMVWADERPPQEVLNRINQHRLTAAELMANAESFEEVESLSYTDSLTGLANQRYFMRRLDEEIDRAKRYGRSVALIIFDLDDLKGVNDRYGHQAGDQVLTQMGDLLRKSIRSIDVVARYGGDEFCIIMPESDKATCSQFMHRLQQKIAGWQFKLSQMDREVTCTVSLGGAIYPQHGETPEQLIYAADMALLKAKESGRNRAQVC